MKERPKEELQVKRLQKTRWYKTEMTDLKPGDKFYAIDHKGKTVPHIDRKDKTVTQEEWIIKEGPYMSKNGWVVELEEPPEAKEISRKIKDGKKNIKN